MCPCLFPDNMKFCTVPLLLLVTAISYCLFACLVDLNYRRITAEEALAQRDGNGSVNLWVNKNEVHNKNNRRGSNDSVTSRRGSNDVGHMRGSNITNNKRYHARLDAGILSDNEEDDIRNNSTRSCSSEESNRG